ncbi:hypothetical protein NM688_g2810 [Phlebia brevispora]|uniref:Uncharacterized protein n=1 Tax=Phlebia brevispora TaxID=194682 RepID=A0ACC1T7K1_9APHY|nr:hypothetical protein NM688_g2810 [Phlebia brevispora]
MSASMPIAVVGVATELPGGADGNLDYPSFWQFLMDKKEAYEKVPADRFNIQYLVGHGANQFLTDTGTFLKDLNLFDNLEFGVTNKDARIMALSSRKLLELSFLALLDSGIDYRGHNVGSFVSGVPHDIVSASGPDEGDVRNSFAFIPSMVANRIAYHLDLRGPSIPTDTACSSSLSALHLACQALRLGECEAAVVGGSQLNHRFIDWLYYSQTGVLAPDGKCKPFDAHADGFSRAEGVVAVVIKPLEAALRDHDKIYGTVVGTAINNCGSLMPIYAPVASAQRIAMEEAFKMAQRDPTEIDFIELHATGTARGDPTEANWVGDMFKRDDELLIGSLKGNLGHMEITAFLGSLAKVCGIFTKGVVPPNINLKTPNPDIHWEEYKFRVPLEAEPVPCRNPNGRPLVALTSSGVGGVNGSVVLEGPPKLPKRKNEFWLPDAKTPTLLMAGGLTPRSSGAVGDQLKEIVEKYDVQNLARVYGRRTRSMTWRSYAVANGNKIRFSAPVLAPRTPPPVVFVFSGQGPQHFDMGRELFRTNAVFRKTVLELDALHTTSMGYSLIERYGLFDERKEYEKLGQVWPIRVTLPSLAILHLAEYEMLVSTGLKPDAVIGHSAGETAVLYASGSGSKELVVELSVARGKSMSLMEDKEGTMAAVNCAPEEAQKFIDEAIAELGPAPLEIGCYNTPDAVTLSGPSKHIDLAVQKADAAGIFARRLRTCVPVHSSMMRLCEDEYLKLSAEVFAKYGVKKPTTAVYSTKTGEFWDAPFSSEYYWDSTRGPVMFTQAMQKLTTALPGATYVEIGPHPVLSSYLQDLAGKESVVTCPLRRAKSADALIEVQGTLDTLGKVVAAGSNSIDFDILYAGTEDLLDPQEPFPFAKKDHPFYSPTADVIKQTAPRNGPLNYAQLQLNAKTHLSLSDHIINGEPIMPAGGYVEAALEYGAKRLWNVEFTSMLSLSSERPIPYNIHLEGNKWTVSTISPTNITYPLNYNRLHASGYLSTEVDEAQDESPLAIKEIQARLAPVDMTGFYDGFSHFAQYGPTYQRITAVSKGRDAEGRDEVLAEVRGFGDDLENFYDYKLHPAVLDAALHVSQHPTLTGYGAGPYYYLPSKIGAVKVHDRLSQKPFPETVYSHGVLTKWTPSAIVYDFKIVDADGALLLTIESLEVARIGTVLTKASKRFELVDQPTEVSVDIKAAAEPTPASHVVLQFARGKELEIQSAIKKLDAEAPQAVWLVAPSGIDGDALTGFARSLRKEYPVWAIRSVVIDPSANADATIQHLHDREDIEDEIHIDADGVVAVPRVSAASAPTLRSQFSAEKPWIFEKSKVKQVSVAQPPRGHVQVQVDGVSKAADNVFAYTGKVAGTSKRVAGIAVGPLSNVVVAHKASIVDLPAGASHNVVAWAIAVTAVGGSSLASKERLQEKSVIVAHADTETGKEVASIFTHLGAHVSTLPSKPTTTDMVKAGALRANIIVSAATNATEIAVFDGLLIPGGKHFAWRQELPSTLTSDPWLIGDAISFGIKSGIETSAKFSAPADLIPAVESEVEYQPELFSANKTYVVLGGVNALGLGIAQWAYQKGAKSIVLSSPSGREELAKSASPLPGRLLSFLETASDLSLSTVALDATSANDVKALISKLPSSLGGVFINSSAGESHEFAAHNEATFEAAFQQTIGTLESLEQATSIDALDFLVAFSSVSGTFGAAGQTSYATASSTLASILKKHKNAVSFVAPVPLESVGAAGSSEVTLTNAEITGYIEDSLFKLKEGPVGQYIPGFNWDAVNASAGESAIYKDLVSKKSEGGAGGQENTINLRELICTTLDVPDEDLADDVPLTQYGLDSLSAAFLSVQLSSVITISQIQLLADVTIKQLQERMGQDPNDAPPEESKEDHVAKKVKAMHEMADKYGTNFVCNSTQGKPDENHKTVLLTGSTGSVGSHMLARLLQSDKTVHVFAFLRKQKQGGDNVNVERQKAAFVDRGLDTELLISPKLTILSGNLTEPFLGLTEERYEQLTREVTHIAHIGWTVNLIIPLSSFDNDLRGLRAMIDLALRPSGRPPMKLIFASTAGIFRGVYLTYNRILLILTVK